MPNTKISALTAQTTMAATDVFPVVQASSSATKKITFANLEAALTLSSLAGTLSVAKGGTGASDAPTALINLGLTATAAELNFTDGVTSAIQTQLDTKAPLASPTFTGTVTMPVGLTGVLRADTGVVAVDTDVTDLVSAASSTLAGKVELALTSEINIGTDSTRAMPIDKFVASARNFRYILFRVVEKTTDWSADASTAVGGDLVIPFTGTIVDIEADSDTAGTTGTAIVDVNLDGSTIMTTDKLKWDSTEKSTRTYSGTAPGLTTTAVTAGGIITLDIDTNHTTKSKGLTLYLAIRLS